MGSNLVVLSVMHSDQHANGPAVGGGAILFLVVVLWLLFGGSGGKK